ncbi:MAG: diaminopimelate epimerase [Fibrobacterota bacterium]
MKFTKMHGIGNDYVFVDCFKNDVPDPAAVARYVSHRHFGIGSDGLILIKPSDRGDAAMEMYNSDGSRAEMCGNGIRCVAKYVYDHGISVKEDLVIETDAGLMPLKLNISGDKAESIKVNMGMPMFAPEKIPVKIEALKLVNHEIMVSGRAFSITCVGMGNPHCVIYVDDVSDFPVHEYGPVIENMDMFPERTNVEFVEVIESGEVRQRTWERGSGETWACGTGASAVCAAGVATGRTGKKLLNHLTGGDLVLEWEQGGPVFMEGPAVEVFSGEITLP